MFAKKRHKHTWRLLQGTKRYYQCYNKDGTGCSKIVKDSNHKHVWGPYQLAYPGLGDDGSFQRQTCKTCGKTRLTKIGRPWFPTWLKIHI